MGEWSNALRDHNSFTDITFASKNFAYELNFAPHWQLWFEILISTLTEKKKSRYFRHLDAFAVKHLIFFSGNIRILLNVMSFSKAEAFLGIICRDKRHYTQNSDVLFAN